MEYVAGRSSRVAGRPGPGGRRRAARKECRPHLRAGPSRGGAAGPAVRVKESGRAKEARPAAGRRQPPPAGPRPTSAASRARPRACPAGGRARRAAACWAPPPRGSTGPAPPRRSGTSAGWTSPAAWPGPPLRSFSAVLRWTPPWRAPRPPFGPKTPRDGDEGRGARGTGPADGRTERLTDVRSAGASGPATSGSSGAGALGAPPAVTCGSRGPGAAHLGPVPPGLDLGVLASSTVWNFLFPSTASAVGPSTCIKITSCAWTMSRGSTPGTGPGAS